MFTRSDLTALYVSKPLFVLALLLFSLNSFSQTPTDQDCLGAIPVCDPIYTQPNSYVGAGAYPNEIPTGGGCPGNCMLNGELNCVWYIVTVQTDGLLGFVISPNNPSDDYDWVVYDLTWARCEDIYSQAAQLQVSCNWSGTAGSTGPNGNSSITCGSAGSGPYCAKIPVNAGETYVINISNYSSTQYGYTLDFSSSTAQVTDNVRPEINHIYSENVVCGDSTLDFIWSENVLCSTISASSFELTGPGGPYTITDLYGAGCALGGEMEKEFTLTVSPNFTISGDYTLKIKPFPVGIKDNCDNIALPLDYDFTLNLNAPVIDETGMEINSSTCGQSNGSITGIDISGNGPFTYEWQDDQGAVVGTDLDLTGVSSGEYTLFVYDPMACQAMGGPYVIQDAGAPAVDETNLQVENNYCNETNGSITGIVITGNEPITYSWTDDAGNPVGGNSPELLDMPGGIYNLLIVDVNSCEALAGPYTIEDYPEPVIYEDNIDVRNSNCGNPDGAILDLDVQGTEPLTYAWFDDLGTQISDQIDLTGVPEGTYTFTAFDPNGCETTVGPYQIINIGGVLYNTVTYQDASCQLFNGSIEVHTFGGYGSVYYSIDDTLTWMPDSTFSNLPPGSYHVVVRDENYCANYFSGNPINLQNIGDSVHVTISGQTPICSGEELQLEVDYDNGFYDWSGPDAFTSDVQNPVITDVQVSNSGSYSVIVTSMDNCSDTSWFNVLVEQSFPIQVEVTAPKTDIYPGESITFTATEATQGTNPVYEWWRDGVMVQSGPDNTYTTTDITTDQAIACYLYVDEVCANPNPAMSNELGIHVYDYIFFMPNSFYPGSQQGNNIFKPVTTAAYIPGFEMIVYSKWGDQVFKSNNLQLGWDGKINGQPAPQGVYVYVINYEIFDDNTPEGKSMTKKGTVMLLR